MKLLQYDCSSCGEPTSAEVGSPRAREELCYREWVKGISFTFRGAQGGRQSFHDDTIQGVINETVAAAKAQGREVRPKTKVGGTAFTAPTKAAS